MSSVMCKLTPSSIPSDPSCYSVQTGLVFHSMLFVVLGLKKKFCASGCRPSLKNLHP